MKLSLEELYVLQGTVKARINYVTNNKELAMKYELEEVEVLKGVLSTIDKEIDKDYKTIDLIKEVINKKPTISIAKQMAYDNIVKIIEKGDSK